MSSRNNAEANGGVQTLSDAGAGLPICAGVKTRVRNDAGFTVIEMLIAFTILAIVSGSLFQMFYVSARNNAVAVDMDMANSLAITAAEQFKTGKNLEETGMFSIAQGAVAGRTWRGADGSRFIKYYDAGWREIEMVLPAAGYEAEVPKNSCFMLEAELGESSGMSPDLNYVAASLSLSLNSEPEYRLVINDNAGEVEAVFNGIPQKIDNSKIGRVISVNVEFSSEGALPKHLAVVNRTGLAANINIFGVPGADAAPDGGQAAEPSESRGKYIEVSPVTGPISVMYLNEQAHSADSVLRLLKVTVRDINTGGTELANVEASVYVPG